MMSVYVQLCMPLTWSENHLLRSFGVRTAHLRKSAHRMALFIR